MVSAATTAISEGILATDSVVIDISGNWIAGSQLVATSTGWDAYPVKLTYQWLRDGSPIRGAGKQNYKLTSRDVDCYISVIVSGSAPGYNSAWLESNVQLVSAQ
jgi:hypothetical protein